ncbi:MAG: glycosyl transferase [Lachnospiraceae bacterium]|nr:glycosyl transferase [Lachnospiraceae bacterium]
MRGRPGTFLPGRIIYAIGIRGGLRFLGSRRFVRLMYHCRNGTWLNLDDPATFNEKLQWLKLHDKNPLCPIWVDKYAAKQYVADCVGEEYVIPTYGVWDGFDDIDFSALPETFVLKCTHDCGGVCICRGKDSWDMHAAKRMITASLKRNYYWVGREWPYRDVPPRILAEKYLGTGENQEESLTDYKVHVFSGVPKVILVCTDRFSAHGMNEDFYDCEWNHLDIRRKRYPNRKDFIPKPEHLGEMISVAAKLAGDVPFVRVDFYETGGRLMFGEMTLYPASGFETFLPEEADQMLGSLLSL